MADNLADAIKAVLEGDATFIAVATGGVATVHTSGANPVNPTDLPDAFSTDATSGVKEFNAPCAVVIVTTDATEREFGKHEWLHLSVYDDEGYANTQAMLGRAHTLLNDQQLTLDDGRIIVLEHVDTPIRNDIDPDIPYVTTDRGGASHEAARYRATYHW